MPAPEREDNTQEVIPDFEIETLARCLLPSLRDFFESPEGKAEFARWKADKDSQK